MSLKHLYEGNVKVPSTTHFIFKMFTIIGNIHVVSLWKARLHMAMFITACYNKIRQFPNCDPKYDLMGLIKAKQNDSIFSILTSFQFLIYLIFFLPDCLFKISIRCKLSVDMHTMHVGISGSSYNKDSKCMKGYTQKELYLVISPSQRRLLSFLTWCHCGCCW